MNFSVSVIWKVSKRTGASPATPSLCEHLAIQRYYAGTVVQLSALTTVSLSPKYTESDVSKNVLERFLLVQL